MKTLNKLIIAGIFLSVMFVFAVPATVQAQYGCAYHSYERCNGNNLYWYDSCGNQQDLAQYCYNGCYNNSCQNYNNTYYNNNFGCTPHSYEKCSGNYLYWYDSCGNQQDLVQYCANGCYNGLCGYNGYTNSYSGCTYHAYRLCSGNNIYWYDSCGTQQDLYSSCGSLTCQYGQCVSYVQPAQTQTQPQASYVVHAGKTCYNNSLYWYDSLGSFSGLYKNCADTNPCTIDTCSGDKCVNTLKCDGTTCATGSADYNTYCQATQPTTTTTTTPSVMSGLIVSFFAKPNSSANTQWQKTADAGSNSQIYFMISVQNNSGAEVDNVSVSANIPSEIYSLGNVQLDNVPISGDIISGINIGSVGANSSKSITFQGKTQTISAASTKQAIATITVSKSSQSDTISINFTSNQNTPNGSPAAVSAAPAANATGLWGFITRWYLWIIAGLVILLLFIIVFRRLSSET